MDISIPYYEDMSRISNSNINTDSRTKTNFFRY